MKKEFDAQCPFKVLRPNFAVARTERRDAVEHRKRILEVAERLFSEQGVAAVSMHQIAQVAGVGQGTLYRRYANKGALCMDLLCEHHEHFASDITAILSSASSLSALEKLDRIITRFVTLLEEQGPLFCPVAVAEMHELTFHEGAISPQHNPFYAWLHALIVSLLTEAVERGETTPLNEVYTADALLAALHPMLYRFQREERGLSVAQIIQGVRRIYIQGLH